MSYKQTSAFDDCFLVVLSFSLLNMLYMSFSRKNELEEEMIK